MAHVAILTYRLFCPAKISRNRLKYPISKNEEHFVCITIKTRKGDENERS